MVLAALLLVALACGFAVTVSVRRLRRIVAVAKVDVEAELRRTAAEPPNDDSPQAKADSTAVILRQLVRELRHAEAPDLRRAVQRELVLTVQETLGPTATTDLGVWRVAAGAGLAGLLLTVWHDRWVGLALGGVGALAAVCCLVCTQQSEQRRRRALRDWRRLLDPDASARRWVYSPTGGRGGGTSST